MSFADLCPVCGDPHSLSVACTPEKMSEFYEDDEVIHEAWLHGDKGITALPPGQLVRDSKNVGNVAEGLEPPPLDAVTRAVLCEMRPDLNGAAAFRQSDLAGKYVPQLLATIDALTAQVEKLQRERDNWILWADNHVCGDDGR